MLGNAPYHKTQPQWKAVLEGEGVRAGRDERGLRKNYSSEYRFHAKCCKMAKHTLKILLCDHNQKRGQENIWSSTSKYIKLF